MLDYVDWCIVTDVSESHGVFVFRMKQFQTFRRIQVCSSLGSTSATAYQSTRCNIPGDVNLQQRCCENLQYREAKSISDRSCVETDI